jgi:hypothetical protein
MMLVAVNCFEVDPMSKMVFVVIGVPSAIFASP